MINAKTQKYLYYGKALDRTSAISFIRQTYKNLLANNSRYAYILDMIVGPKVLDYGCGWGVFTKIISKHHRDVIGIDIDAESVRAAKDLVGETPRLKFKRISIKKIPDTTFDSIVSTCVIPYTLNPGNYLSECNRVLKTKGQLIITIYNEVTPLYLLSHLLISESKINKIYSEDRNVTKDRVLSWSFYNFCRLAMALGFSYSTHRFNEGIQTPFGYVKIFFLKPFYNSVTFVFTKDRYVHPDANG